MFFLPNVVSKQLKKGLPWEFVSSETISEEIRHTLTARQAWYRNSKTNHCFYTFVEGASDVQRCTQDTGENPARLIHGIVADYDLKLTEAEIRAGIEKMGNRKPGYWETSLGGKFRLLWLFETPLRVLSTAFAVSALKFFHDWLPLDKLPGLDEPAFIDPTKTYANGCIWVDLGNPKISSDDLGGIFVHVAREFSNRGPEAGPEIPFDVVYKALLEKFPSLRWPSEFVLNSQGPSFWVPGSTSPNSAIVKESGIITFAAHAERTFYSWRELLGSEFVEKYELQTLSDATKELFYDGKQYWRKLPSGLWQGETFDEIRQYLKIDCKVSAKTVGGEPSQLDRCLQHIRNYNRVDGAAPYVFRPVGVLSIDGAPFLNTWRCNVVQPVAGSKGWGDAPFLASLLPRLFVNDTQLNWVLSWLAYCYQNVLEKSPVPGHALFLAGGVGTGKSLFCRYIVGGLLGKFQDASAMFLGNDPFNSELFEAGVWCIDDETMTGDERIRRRFASMVKKVTANCDFRHNRKFAVASKVEWVGRLTVTLNIDQTSNRILVDPEASMMEKVALVRAADEYKDFHFPKRAEIIKILGQELPVFARMLADWQIPAEFRGDSRYGIKPHHNESMLEQASQSAPTATFIELIMDWRQMWFACETRREFWEGTTTQLIRTMSADPQLERLVGRYSPEQVGRLLASVRAQNVSWITCHTNPGNQRVWRIYREGNSPIPVAPVAQETPISEPEVTNPNPFQKI